MSAGLNPAVGAIIWVPQMGMPWAWSVTSLSGTLRSITWGRITSNVPWPAGDQVPSLVYLEVTDVTSMMPSALS